MDAVLKGPSWDACRAALSALDGVPLSDDQATLFRRHTGRTALPTGPYREAFFVVGRRGGKSRIAALKAVEAAVFRSYRLAPGERAIVMVVAADRHQARVVFSYIRACFDVPPLAGLVERMTAEAIHLKNHISVEIHTASFRAVRGYTIVAAICDEIAFWRDETSANPDVEILNAIRPALSTVPGAQLICISSPYARRGVMWAAFHRFYGTADDRVLVWQADTRAMNPSVDADIIAEAYERDPASAAAEYGAQFRADIESFVSREAIDAVVVSGRLELPPVPAIKYVGFVDPSGGAADAMTLAIAHSDKAIRILDAIREVQPPFSPEAVVRDFAALLGRYKITRVTGDRYAGEWPREQFKKLGITYDPAAAAKSDIYRNVLPLINSRIVELLDVARLRSQLGALERRTARGGRDSIDHPPNQHDDLANAALGALAIAEGRPKLMIWSWPGPEQPGSWDDTGGHWKPISGLADGFLRE